MALVINREAVDAMKEVENVQVSAKPVDGVPRLGFEYLGWAVYRHRLFDRLRRHTRTRWKMGKARRAALNTIVAGFVGSRRDYDRRMRKVAFAKMMDALRATCPEMDRERLEVIASA